MEERREYDRRRDDQGFAEWRGGIEARVEAIEKHVDGLIVTSGQNSMTVVRMESEMRGLRKDVSAAVSELRSANTAREARRFSWSQVVVAGMFATVAACIPTLVTLAAAGHL